jgi:hypothetical protein
MAANDKTTKAINAMLLNRLNGRLNGYFEVKVSVTS